MFDTEDAVDEYDERVAFLAKKWKIPWEEAQRLLENQRHD